MKKHYCDIGSVNKRIKQLDPYNNKIYSSRDEVTNGRLFADVFKNDARFNITSKCWSVYNGIIWELDTESMIVERYAKMLYKALYLYAEDKDRNYISYVSRLGNRQTRQKMILDAREHNHISKEDLDQNENLFNVLNGILNLETREFFPHESKYLLSKCANVEYIPETKSPDFENFINQIMCNDQEKVKYIQKTLGMSLTTDTSREECYLHYGATTRNGKSTLLETVSYLMGDYALTMNPESLAQCKRDSRNASSDIARLNGCRFLQASEPPKRMVLDVALLKTLLGRDTLTARELYERNFEFIPKFKLHINTNYLPVVNDDSLFSSGRVKVISYDRHFEEHEQDKELKARLKLDKNLSGIFNWLLEGLALYRKEGLIPSNNIKLATDKYREDSDKIKLFIGDCLVKDDSNTLEGKTVYENYSAWCKANGYGVENKRNFFDELKTKNLLSTSGTVNGRTVRNVIKGYSIEIDFTNDLATQFKEQTDNNPFIS